MTTPTLPSSGPSTPASDPECPVDSEGISPSAQLGKRLLCTAQHALRIRESGELKPTKLGTARTYYRTSDLDVIRSRLFEGIRAKAGLLNSGERQQLAAVFTMTSALSAGRETPSQDDREVGERIADREFSKVALAELRQAGEAMRESHAKLKDIVGRFEAALAGGRR